MSVILCFFVMAASELVAGPVEIVADGFEFTEGPVWLPTNQLIFSDIPANTIYYADKTVYRTPSGKSNGLRLDTKGRVIACQHGERQVARLEEDDVRVLADRYEGTPLNSPNDAVVRSDGAIFFTDPPYGLEGREPDLDFHGVYVITPEGEVKLLDKDFVRPNGIGLSPDEKTLYVADTQESHIRAFDVAGDGSVSNGRKLCDVPFPDGMAVDTEGRIWSTSREGVVVFDSAGNRLGVVEFPQWPANCAFGGEDGKTLFVTARTSVYKVEVAVPGIRSVLDRR